MAAAKKASNTQGRAQSNQDNTEPTRIRIQDIWRSALARIAVAVVLLGATMGALDYWIEIELVDDAVVKLAEKETHNFVNRFLAEDSIKLDDPEIKTAIQVTLIDRFPIVELYDKNQQKHLEVIADGKEWVEGALKSKRHGFPVDNQPIYHRIDVGDSTFIQVLIPIRLGFFEGIYQLDEDTISEINQRLLRAVLTVFLSVVVAGALLFPLLMVLNREVIRTSRAILTGNIELMEVLGSAIAKRDSDTNIHNYRVTLYAIELANAVKLPDEEMRSLIAGSFLHDVGKIGIPDAILLKPGKLDEQEFDIMKTHVELGGHILSKSTWLTAARDVVLNHHEKFNGSGYPHRIKDKEIPLSARIFAIVDVFDALTSKRPYKEPMPLEQSLDILRRDTGSHFDPDLVAVFVNIAPKLYQQMWQIPDKDIEAMLRRSAAGYFGLGY